MLAVQRHAAGWISPAGGTIVAIPILSRAVQKLHSGMIFGSDSLRHAGRPAVLDFYASRAVAGDVRAGPYQGERGVPGRFPSGHPTRASLIATLSGSGGQPNVVATVTGNNLLVVPASLLTNDPRAIELWLILLGPDQASTFARTHPAGPSNAARDPARSRDKKGRTDHRRNRNLTGS